MPQRVKSNAGNQRAGIHLKPKGVFLAFVIPFSKKLSAKNTGAGDAAENTDIKDKHQLVDDGHTGHLLRTHLAHHNVVQKTHKAGDGVLDDHGERKKDHIAIKLPVTYKSLFKTFPHNIHAFL